MIKHIRHYGFSVKDEKKALHFYCDLLGFKVFKKAKEDEDYIYKLLGIKDLTFIKLIKETKTGLFMLELYLLPKDRKKGRWNHVAFTVGNIDKLYRRLKKEGIKFLSTPTYDSKKEHKLCFCRDYNNNLIELVEEIGRK